MSHLWQVAASGGEPKRLTPDGFGLWRTDVSVPTARRSAFGVTDARPVIYQLPRLGCSAWPSNRPAAVTVVTKEFDRPVGSWSFAPDSQTIYFTAEDAGHERIYAGARGGRRSEARRRRAAGRVHQPADSALAASSAVAFANWESAVRPVEIVRIDPATGNRDVPDLVHDAEAAESIDWQPLREFWFTGRDGRRIHNFVALPPNFDESKKYPLFVLIHGGHASMWRDSITYRWNYHLLAQPGFVVLMTDYRGSTGYGEKFTLDILGDPLNGPADDINDAADEAIKRFAFIDGTRQAAGGASYGGHLTNWLAGTTTRYRCLVSHAGPGHARDAVGHQRRHLSPRADDGRARTGRTRRSGSRRARSPRRATSRRRCCSPSA